MKRSILPAHLVIRADAEEKNGIGHVMRCLALFEAWQDAKGRATLVGKVQFRTLRERLRSAHLWPVELKSETGSAQDATETATVARERAASWIVLDGYHFTSAYQRILKQAGFRILLIDDTGGRDHHYADIVLNQNTYASQDLYPNREPYTQLLLGSRYVLLRKEFIIQRHAERHKLTDSASRLLVTFGGGEQTSMIGKTIRAVRNIDGLETVIMIPEGKASMTSLPRTSKARFRVEAALAKMAEMIAWADVAISGAGSTTWELAYMGLPSIVVVLAENQSRIAESLQSKGIALNLGWHSSVRVSDMANAILQITSTPQLREKMRERGRLLVDGQGARRAVAFLRKFD